MTKTISCLAALLFVFSFSVSAQQAGQKKSTTQAKTTTPVKITAAPAKETAKPEKALPFCPEFKKILEEALTNFDAIKGDTVRASKSIIIATKVSMPDMSMSRISVDKASNQTFYRSFLDGNGNITVVKQKFDGLKTKIKNCINDKKWVEKNTETDTDTDYSRFYTLSEHPQDNKSKEYKGRVLDIEVEFNKSSDTEYSIMFTLTNYK